MTTEQPYFTVRVTRCGECPHLAEDDSCWLVPGVWPYPSKPHDAVEKNRNGITPTCPMWPQRVQEKANV